MEPQNDIDAFYDWLAEASGEQHDIPER